VKVGERRNDTVIKHFNGGTEAETEMVTETETKQQRNRAESAAGTNCAHIECKLL